MPRNVMSLAIAVTLVGIPISGECETWLPLQTGFSWTYVDSSDASEVRTVEGIVTLRGNLAYSILFHPSDFDEGLRNYWTTTPDGDVLIHGFFLPEGWGYAYDPPIVLLDAPLFVGKVWHQSVDVYELPGETFAFSTDVAFQVYEEGPLDVPAGKFETFGVGQTVPMDLAVASAPVNLDGTLRTMEAGGQATYFWAANIGLVRQIVDTARDLVSFTFPTAVAQTSWASIKALYR